MRLKKAIDSSEIKTSCKQLILYVCMQYDEV